MSNTSRPSTPQDATPSQLWALYTTFPFPHELVDFPISEKALPAGMVLPQMAVVPITLEEQILCQIEADDFAKTQMKKNPPKQGEVNTAWYSIYEKEVTLHILWRACRDPSDPKLQKRVFTTPKEMRQKITPDQLSILAHTYVRAERLLSPIQAEMTGEEMDFFVEKLRLGGRSSPLDWLSSEQQTDLIWHLISRLPSSPTPSGSPGTPPESSSSPNEVTVEAEPGEAALAVEVSDPVAGETSEPPLPVVYG